MADNRKRWIAPILWGMLLISLSLMPGGQGNILLFGIPYIDKIAHFGIYAIWCFLILYAWKGNSRRSELARMWITFLVAAMTGVLLEFGQATLTMGRSFEIADMVANAAGALAGVVFWRVTNQRKSQNLQSKIPDLKS
jgi:VanZ family protein